MSPKLFMCESLWWVTFSCIVYTIEKIHKLYSVMCESAWIHLTVSTTTDSRWHIVHARFSMHMIREAIAFFSESTLLGGQRQRWSKKWNRFWISFWRCRIAAADSSWLLSDESLLPGGSTLFVPCKIQSGVLTNNKKHLALVQSLDFLWSEIYLKECYL